MPESGPGNWPRIPFYDHYIMLTKINTIIQKKDTEVEKMNKKLMTLFVMAILMISAVPLAFAQGAQYGQENTDSEDMMEDDSDADMPVAEPIATPPRPALYQAREQVREVRGEARDLRQDARQVRAGALRLKQLQQERLKRFNERPVKPMIQKAKEDFARAREMYQQAKERYAKAKDMYKEQRQNFVKAKDEWNKCKGAESTECDQKRERLKEQAQPHLLKSADLVLKELERVKAKVESSEDLSDEERTDLVAKLDAKIAEVTAAKEKIENLGEDATKEEINDAAKTIREAWQATKLHLKKAIGRLAGARLGNIILKTEKLEERFANVRDKLAEKGADVTALDSILDDFSAKLDEAADKYNKAKELWKGANTPGEVDEAAKEVHTLMKEAQESLKEAKGLLREAVQEIRKMNKGSLEVADDSQSDDEEEEVEVEEEEEVEEENETETESEDDTEDDGNETSEDDEEEDDDDEEDESDEDSEEEGA